MPDDEIPDLADEPNDPSAAAAADDPAPPTPEVPGGCSPFLLLLSCAGLTLVTMIVAGSLAYAGWWALTDLGEIDPWPFD